MTGAISLRFASEVISVFVDYEVLDWIVVLSSLTEILGIALFFFNRWPRIRASGSKLREASGEKF